MRTSMRVSRKGSSQVCCTPAERAHMSVLHTHRVCTCERAVHPSSACMRSRCTPAERVHAIARKLKGGIAHGRSVAARRSTREWEGALCKECVRKRNIVNTMSCAKPLVGRPPAPPRARFLPRILKKELTRGREAGSIRFRRFRREDGEAREAKPPEPAP